MSWIKKANKIGKYECSYRRFRIYCTKQPVIKKSVVIRNGEECNCTDFIKGCFVAIDKTDKRFEADSIEQLGFHIDKEHTRRYFSKKEGVELEWGPRNKIYVSALR